MTKGGRRPNGIPVPSPSRHYGSVPMRRVVRSVGYALAVGLGLGAGIMWVILQWVR